MKRLIATFLRWRGWRFVGDVPDLPRIVVVGAHHTSNLDFFVFLAALHEFEMDVAFIGKHTLFRWPLGTLMRKWGGIAVDRNRPEGLANQVADAMRDAEHTILVISPEGTRRRVSAWKNGFIRIAEAGDAAIVFAALDYPGRQVVIGPTVAGSRDSQSIMNEARRFYEPFDGRRADRQGPVRLGDESSGLLG